MGVITSEINEQPRPPKTQGVPHILKNRSALTEPASRCGVHSLARGSDKFREFFLAGTRHR